ncbi:MAG TPA: rod shape-determining protein RodA [Actinomycetota bacterium]|nr:rod shape-determining protein RodA [Actinomycetota bacterium]
MAFDGVFEAVDRIGGEPISARMARKAPIRHLDPTLLLTTLMLSAFGALMVLSATASQQEAAGLDPGTYFKRQLAYMAAGALLLLFVSFFDYRHFRGFAPFIYAATVIALIVVLTPLGDVQSGARRWIDFGAFQAQPSELAKIAVIVTVAAWLAERKTEVNAVDVAICGGLVAVPAVLIYLEPDLGTMIVFAALLGALLLVGGAKLRHFLALGAVGVVLVATVLQAGLLEDYQLKRITAFLDPNPDVQSVGYNLAQSEIAIGSGGITGKGLQGEKTQTTLDFVPEQHTDFIFTAVGEQLGFVGSAVLLVLFAFLIWRALRIANLSRDLFGTLVAAGIGTLWAFQLFVNVGMTMGIMPITGIPLPFVSFGGSSLLTNYLAVGLLLNIHMRRFL